MVVVHERFSLFIPQIPLLKGISLEHRGETDTKKEGEFYMKSNVLYPIEESVDESWERFAKIYELSDMIVGEDQIVPVYTQDIRASWAAIAMFWKADAFRQGTPNFLYEAIYHVRYRKFSPNVNTHEELLLTLMVEDELCRCGYAFQVWCNLEEFKEAYQELLFPAKHSRGWNAFCPVCLKLYLAGSMANRIMLKDRRPIDWGAELDCDSATYPYGPDYMRYRITVYERAISILIPESDQWYEEWTDGDYAVKCIKDKYGMDFTNDPEGFDHLIDLATEKNFPRYCALPLYALKNVTSKLLDTLWGEKSRTMVQRCFLVIYSRYKISKKNTKRSKYSAEKLADSWLYQWMDQKRMADELDPKMRNKIRSAMLKIALNI